MSTPPPPPRPPAWDTAPTVPQAAALACAGCGATLEPRTFGRAVTIACRNCGAVLDASEERVTLVARARDAMKYTPDVPLGSRGTFDGIEYEAIGFQVRGGSADGESWAWHEYLLFNPWAGYRYLVTFDGHWTLVDALDALPTAEGRTATFEDRRFKHFTTAPATVLFVLGEFPWRVAVGDAANCADYVAPPYVLSSEETPGEVTWSLGRYLEAREVREAFRLKGALPGRSGVYLNQPNPWSSRSGRLFPAAALLTLVLLVAWIGALATASRKTVFHQVYEAAPGAAAVREDGTAAPGGERAFVTDEFELTGGPQGVEVETKASVDNAWVFVGYALIEADKGNAWDFGREVGYYHGRDSDGNWTEGSQVDRALLPAVPAGRYYLRIEPEADPKLTAPVRYEVTVQRGVPSNAPFVAALLLILLPPLWIGYRSWSFEVKRWQDSDHPIVTRGE